MLLLFSSLLWAAPIPTGTDIESAVTVDFPPQGFDALEGVIPGLIPSPISIPDFVEGNSTCTYQIELKGATADVNVQNVFLTPVPDQNSVVPDQKCVFGICPKPDKLVAPRPKIRFGHHS